MILGAHCYGRLADDLNICRILNGMWQVSGGHGRIRPDAAVTQMLSYHDAGFTTWDLADHYGPAEDFIGLFRQRLREERGEAALERSAALTKWVPRPGPITAEQVEAAVTTSRSRMGVDCLDLLQFHWWDYADEGYLTALQALHELQKRGQIRHLGLTNFDSVRLEQILAAGIPIVSNQIQYSLIDRRPEVKMVEICRQGGVSLLTYGTLCGGLLSESYLDLPEPTESKLNTLSLRKYYQVIVQWGGWKLFQELLQELKNLADRHGVSLANVATRAILDRPAVGGVIVGTRLGVSEHIADTAHVFDLNLDKEELQPLERILERGRNLFELVGDVGAEYRS